MLEKIYFTTLHICNYMQILQLCLDAIVSQLSYLWMIPKRYIKRDLILWVAYVSLMIECCLL